MKRFNLIALSLMLTASSVLAGGLVTNTNQSSAWARTLTREASTGVDAVYYNPAGLAQLKNGLHLSISNQSIFQTRTITNTFPAFNSAPESMYEAELAAPLFPSVYAAFKMDKWTFSGGFNIIGGGGTANFESGLPSIEMSMLALAPTVNAILGPVDAAVEAATGTNPMFATTSGYNMESAFSGSSTYMGYQVGATYAINDMISVAIGGRFVSAKNVYEGSLDAMVNTEAHMGGVPAYPGDYIRTAATAVGMGDDPTLNGYASALDVATKDATVDAVQKGTGFTPIIGVNFRLTDMINIAAKYEHHTKIELTNETTNDDVGMFPDGEKSRGDLPGHFSLGAQLKPIDKISANIGFNYFLDKGAFYGKTNIDGEQINNESTIDDNAYSISASLQYQFLAILGASVGYSFGNLGVNDDYQSDMSYGLKSNTIAGGVFVHLGEMMILNAGVVFVNYDDYEKEFTTPAPYSEIYGKNTTIYSIGLDISLGGK